ncbi:MAG: type II toxin-antitoxin system VapC family toxin [Phaeodactylibacter sp.]|nr:type II toxin-antitoxin system VapC family toxin [Phaeodactylibacter sp.]MCB9292522.1 type II toxin-antitoxin system VapC family toxin [Lewinellaceae bacterium]
MGKPYLIDSNAVIDYLMGKLPPSGTTFMDKLVNDIPNVSIITKIEVLGFPSSPSTEKLLTAFFDDAVVLGLSDRVAEKVIELRKSNKIKLPDAVIASTAMVHDMDLVTRNTTDFDKISGLVCINPHAV